MHNELAKGLTLIYNELHGLSLVPLNIDAHTGGNVTYIVVSHDDETKEFIVWLEMECTERDLKRIGCNKVCPVFTKNGTTSTTLEAEAVVKATDAFIDLLSKYGTTNRIDKERLSNKLSANEYIELEFDREDKTWSLT